MIARVTTVAFQGIEACPVEVQVHVGPGLPGLTIVGLPDKAVTEARERVRAALHALGLALPPKRMTINLAPADVQKEGSHYDLPLALALLVALDVLPQEPLNQEIVMGELGLDGSLAPVAGVLSAAVYAASCARGIICPLACGAEAAWAGQVCVTAPAHLFQLVAHLKGQHPLPPHNVSYEDTSAALKKMTGLEAVRGQATSKRALIIAAAGGHHMAMIGPPGAGKSLLASCMPALLPPLEPRQALEVTMLHSLAGRLNEGQLIRHPPYREPHHSASMAALIGGGIKGWPGEVSLAHGGVLFLDELPEFSRQALEALRQPLETGRVTVARAQAHWVYPARFQLIAAMNPCRCGYANDPMRQCRRVPVCVSDYRARVSGPIWDRIDMTLMVEPLPVEALQGPAQGSQDETLQARHKIMQARAFQDQRAREQDLPCAPNAHRDGQALSVLCPLTEASQRIMSQAVEKWGLSARGYYRVLRVARTIADLETREVVDTQDIAEALSYRLLEKSA